MAPTIEERIADLRAQCAQIPDDSPSKADCERRLAEMIKYSQPGQQDAPGSTLGGLGTPMRPAAAPAGLGANAAASTATAKTTGQSGQSAQSTQSSADTGIPQAALTLMEEARKTADPQMRAFLQRRAKEIIQKDRADEMESRRRGELGERTENLAAQAEAREQDRRRRYIERTGDTSDAGYARYKRAAGMVDYTQPSEQAAINAARMADTAAAREANADVRAAQNVNPFEPVTTQGVPSPTAIPDINKAVDRGDANVIREVNKLNQKLAESPVGQQMVMLKQEMDKTGTSFDTQVQMLRAVQNGEMTIETAMRILRGENPRGPREQAARQYVGAADAYYDALQSGQITPEEYRRLTEGGAY